MRVYASLIFSFACLQTACAEIRLLVISEGKPVGKAYLKWLDTPTGGHQAIFTMIIGQGDRAIRIHEEGLYTAEGAPISRKIETLQGKDRTDASNVKFVKDAVVVDHVTKNKTTHSTEQIDPKLNLKDATQAWFRTVQPKSGDKDIHYTYDPVQQRFYMVESVYKGKVKVTASGKEVEANLVESHSLGNTTSSWFDDQGDLVVLMNDSLRMERVWEEKKDETKRK